MTRLGKIARLPRLIREQLNARLREGEEGKLLIEWLNELPEAQAVLSAQFGGRPINAQNLTEWKQGGFEDWLQHQEDCARARILVETAGELEKEAGEIALEDRLAAPMAIALARLMRETGEFADVADKHKALLNIARELARLRHESHLAERVRIEREQWDTKQADAEKARQESAAQKIKLQSLMAQFPQPYSGVATHWGVTNQNDVIFCLEANKRLRGDLKGTPGAEKQSAAER